MQTTGWLTEIGREELHLIKELGWDHPDVLKVQQKFRDAFRSVKQIRQIYESPSAERTYG